MEDADVPAFWRGLGVPGLFDVHVHFLPEPIQRAVWKQFDEAGPKLGREWPINYRHDVNERVRILRSLGVRRFTSLPYAHKPGVAGYLNDWAFDFASNVSENLWSATFYPEPDVGKYVARLVWAGVEIFKLHTQVGEFLLDDPMLDPAWEVLEDSGTPVLIHVGSGPVPNSFTGPAHLARLLRKHPRLRVIVAHMGAPEYAEFLELAETHDGVHLDTTMVFTDFFDEAGEFPRELLPRLVDLQPKILLGTDFPSIPYAYAHQLEALARLDLGDDWLRAVCWHNGARIFG